jgi:predicted nucleic acid-binding protein
MIKVFLDTNVFLDLLLERGEFADASEKILRWCEEGELTGVTSALNIANIYYIVKKQKSKSETKKVIRNLLGFIGIANTTKKDLLLALDSSFDDFEDAIQYYSALNIDDINFIITRNIKDYNHSTIPVITSEDFVLKYG